ncbi:Iridoid synthase [Naviculisporaceae sp. PSN 640]
MSTPENTSIVVGATGILGREIVKELAKDWKQVHALSRSKKDDYPSNVEHNYIDLTSSAEEMAKTLQGVEAEYIFFAAYLQKDSEQENWDVNGDMLGNYLKSLELTGAVKKVKRIILVTGCKQYGVHLGQVKNPMLESDPWLRDSTWPPNFYYRQQDILKEFCEKKHPEISWIVTYPNDVIGFANGNFMNLASGVGIYAAVSKELGQDLIWPGSETFYTKFDTFTSSKLHAQFCKWAAVTPGTANQAFNVVNDDVQSWQDLWPRVAKRFGMKVKEDQFSGSESKWASSTTLPTPPPISLLAHEVGLSAGGSNTRVPAPIENLAKQVGLSAGGSNTRVPPSKLEQRINLTKWSQEKEVKEAWDRLAEREGLQKDAFEKATWGFLDFILGRNFDVVASMSKAKKHGWVSNPSVDTWQALDEVFGELEAAKVLPSQK